MTTSELPKIHPKSQAGFGLGKSELYDKYRPSYPHEALSHIEKALPGKDQLKVVEIGSGSGLFTRSVLADPQWNQSIAEMKCIEPNEGMRAVFSKKVNDSRVSLADGVFERTGVPDNWADIIIIATAFNWCTDFEGATKEFIRILKPEGVVCLLWNFDDKDKAPWVQQVFDICMLKYNNPSSGTVDHSKWCQTFDLPVYKEHFTPPEETIIPYAQNGTLESVIARYMTWSGIALLPENEKEELKEGIRAIIEKGDGLVWVDEKEGIFEVPLAVRIIIFRRKS